MTTLPRSKGSVCLCRGGEGGETERGREEGDGERSDSDIMPIHVQILQYFKSAINFAYQNVSSEAVKVPYIAFCKRN